MTIPYRIHSCHRRLTICIPTGSGWQESRHHRAIPAIKNKIRDGVIERGEEYCLFQQLLKKKIKLLKKHFLFFFNNQNVSGVRTVAEFLPPTKHWQTNTYEAGGRSARRFGEINGHKPIEARKSAGRYIQHKQTTKKQPNNLVYIINLLIFANRKVEGNAIATSAFHFLSHRWFIL